MFLRCDSPDEATHLLLSAEGALRANVNPSPWPDFRGVLLVGSPTPTHRASRTAHSGRQDWFRCEASASASAQSQRAMASQVSTTKQPSAPTQIAPRVLICHPLSLLTLCDIDEEPPCNLRTWVAGGEILRPGPLPIRPLLFLHAVPAHSYSCSSTKLG